MADPIFQSIQTILDWTDPRSIERYNAVIDFLDFVCEDGDVYRPTEREAIQNICGELRRSHIDNHLKRREQVSYEFDVREAAQKVVTWLVEEVLDEDGAMMCRTQRGYIMSSSPRLIWMTLYLSGYVWVQMAHIKEAQQQITHP